MAIYYDTVTRYEHAKANSYPIAASVGVEIVITLIVQCFFSLRIYKLSNRLPVSISCLVFALLRFIGGVAISVKTFSDVPRGPVNGIGLGVRFDWLITSALTSGAATDILIAICMTYYLRKFASPTNLTSTTMILNKLIRFSLQTGLITSMTSVAVIICFQAMPNMIWFGLYIILAKLYSNSLFVSLNARPVRQNGNARGNLTHRSILEFSPGTEPISISFQTSRPGDLKPVFKIDDV
ncbi:hypothetical protein JR316_0005432 [Psilocybe cubensis]|uniref:DUF6534 domain-containing protein n=2 Tax=Psilocybe cubensis TaxID=181762 RepID=A0A8H7XJ34_PSICU|nr:hypothetical protein JR316_0005432 [Psilocybe cubensis]KAH9483326.1 hypothetical protein JR316_0005432 [Psilocybe cubensis]